MLRRLGLAIIAILSVLLLVSCTITDVDDKPLTNEFLNVYYLNDTHGAILENNKEIGLSKIGNVIIEEFDNNPDDTIFITGGDMFQGQIISNENKGALMVELLNEMKLDAFVIGNHEFDWDINRVLKYFDNSSEGVKANFPALGANIFRKSDDKLLSNVEPYTIIERGNLTVGIIGVMGYGLESSIKSDRIEDYYFKDPAPIIKEYTKILRKDKDVDVVLVAGHDSSESLNYNISGLSGDYLVDAIFNGHNHRPEIGKIKGTPHLQAGSNGEALGNMGLHYSYINNELTTDSTKTSIVNLKQSDDNRFKNNVILDAKIGEYYEEIKHIYEDVLITAGENLSQSDLSEFITRAMTTYLDVDVAIQNNGGTRSRFFRNQEITAADLFQVFPFDNRIMIYESYGSKVERFKDSSWLTSYSNITSFTSNIKYSVATNDYVYLGNEDQAISGSVSDAGDLYEFLLMVVNDLVAKGHTKLTKDINFS